jgi:hypothetical protein
MDLNQIVKGVTLTKVCSISPDKDSNEFKNITLKVKFDGVPLQGIFDKAISQTVIQWQNGPGRKKFDQWNNNQVVEVEFKSPARTTIDPMAQILAEATAAGVDTTDSGELAKYIMNRLNR